MSGLVRVIACYRYFTVLLSRQGAYKFAEDVFTATGKGFDDFYRYADWILTVPLLVAELIAVMNMGKGLARPLLADFEVAQNARHRSAFSVALRPTQSAYFSRKTATVTSLACTSSVPGFTPRPESPGW